MRLFGPDQVVRWRPAIYVSIFVFVLLWTLTILPLRLPRPERVSDAQLPEQGRSMRPRIVPRILVVIIDGMGMNAAMRPGWMPRFQKLTKEGAFGIAQASFPTMTTPGITSIVTGRRPPPGMGFPGAHKAEPQYDSVIARATAAKLRVFVVGQTDWPALFGAHGAKMAIVPYRGSSDPIIDYDRRLLPLGKEILQGKRGRWDLVYLHLFDLDVTGHHFGMNSPEYRQKLDWLDARIQSIVAAAGSDALVIITADHGQTEAGTHGGIEPEVRNIPLLLLGPKVQKGDFGIVAQQDVAATVAALLGLPQPALSIGRPILKVVKLSPRERADIWMDVLDQRKREWLAARSNWPWWARDPRTQMRQAEDLFRKGKYAQAETISRKAALRIDGSLASLSPKVWFGRIVLALWLVTLAACFSLAWPNAPPVFLRLASALGAIGLLILFLPSVSVTLWPLASGLAVLVAGSLMTLSLIQGSRGSAMVRPLEWAGWWLALAAIACPNLVDLVLWSWLAMWGFCLANAWKCFKQRRDLVSASLCLVTLTIATIITTWRPGVENSVLRTLLPSVNLRWLGMPSWTAIELCLWPAVAAFAYFRLRSLPEARNRYVLYACALFLMAGSYVAARFEHELSEWMWAIAFLSIILLIMKPIGAQLYGFWLSLLSLFFCHSLLPQRDFCFLLLATLTGWGLLGVGEPKEDFWQGLQVLALTIWTFVAADGHLTISRISVSEVNQVLGHQWHPYVMATLLFLKHVALAITPGLPLLAQMRWRSMLGLFPFLGALSGGNLVVLWMQQFFMTENPTSLGDDSSFEMTLWAVFFGWGIMILWSLVHGSFRFAQLQRDNRLNGGESGSDPAYPERT